MENCKEGIWKSHKRGRNYNMVMVRKPTHHCSKCVSECFWCVTYVLVHSDINIWFSSSYWNAFLFLFPTCLYETCDCFH